MAPVTQKDIDETRTAVRKAEEKNRTVQTNYKKASTALAGAIQDKNESMVKLYRSPLNDVAKEIADCLQDVEFAISRVNYLQQDEEFMKTRFALVEQLLGGVSKMRTLLTKQLLECKRLDKAANDSLGELTGDQEDAASEYAHLEKVANDLQAIVPTANKHFAAAAKAIADHKQEPLTAARMALLNLEFGKLKMTAKAHMPKVKEFLKKYPQTELKADADWLHDSFQKLHDDFATYEKKTLLLVEMGQISATEKDADQDETAKIDVAKAAKVLGIAAKDQPKLNKVLTGRPGGYEKALSALAAELELEEQNGKKLVAMLEKAKVLQA